MRINNLNIIEDFSHTLHRFFKPCYDIIAYLGFFSFYPIPFMTVSSSSPSFPLNTILYMLTIKLTSSNYLLWRNQFILLFTSHDLLRFLDGSVSVPSPQIIGSDHHLSESNLHFLAEYRPDSLKSPLFFSYGGVYE